jgi:hypothetical protein
LVWVSAQFTVFLLSSVFIGDASAGLCFGHCPGSVDAVKVTEVVEADVSARITDARLKKLLNDTVATAADRVILELHDGSSSQSAVVVKIAGECWDCGHEDPDVEWLAFMIGTDDSIYQRSTDLVLNHPLLVVGSSDEELDCQQRLGKERDNVPDSRYR